ncbi:hypothetical protein [Streptomyces sp. NBC_00878]|uniref:hypothetical protein n=1 Tax=Streptomyces sp. NBC_00878 TaxID=2975854 RepID=UPI00224D79A5|nr:hypothetical protein [Streptomyces sp. NBC_00878]MCX4908474.1 hypothetical protein [Streptomyces sp. NBC_00878]
MLSFTRGRVIATAVGTAALLFAAQGTAAAAPVRANTEGGYVQWNADPYDGIPGDSFRACDTTADGWGIEARLDVNRNGTTDQQVSTRGHDAPYCTGWVYADLAEGTPIALWAVTVRGSEEKPQGGLLWSHA